MFPAAAVASVPKKVRSALSNDVRRLPGVSMKSAQGRRYRDICEELLREFGQDADTARVRELASLKYGHEALQADFVGGDTTKADDLVRLSNLISRREKELRARRKAARAAMTPPAHSLESIIARHRAAEAAAKAAASSPTSTQSAVDGDNEGPA